MEILIIVLMCLAAAVFVLSPFIIKKGDWQMEVYSSGREDLENEKEIFYQAIKDVDFEYAEGKLSDKDHDELRAYYKEKAVFTVRKIENINNKSVRKDGIQDSAQAERGPDD